MEIWVMSQEKTKLESCSYICTYPMKDNGDGIYEMIRRNELIDEGNVLWNVSDLGFYSTKEKALKVLEMMRTHIETSAKQTIQTHEDEWLHYNADVFQMPQDDEVE